MRLESTRVLHFGLFVCLFDLFLTSHQQSFSKTGTGLSGLNQYQARINVSCSRTTTQHLTPVRLEPAAPGGGGGGTLMFSHIRRLGPFFWVQNSEFQYYFGFSEKLISFWGMKILWIFFWGHHKIGVV